MQKGSLWIPFRTKQQNINKPHVTSVTLPSHMTRVIASPRVIFSCLSNSFIQSFLLLL